MKIEPAFMVKHPHVPHYLYKYRSFLPNHLGALDKNVLWMSAPERFNDPYDGAVTFHSDRFLMEDLSIADFLALMKTPGTPGAATPWVKPFLNNPIPAGEWRRKVAAELLKDIGLPADQDTMAQAVEEFMRRQNDAHVQRMTAHFRQGFSVLSLSDNAWSMLMWSHYSDSHKGFCIEFDFSALPYGDLRRRLCFPVFYTAKLRDATRYLSKGTSTGFNNLFGQLMCQMKKADWDYEREWRIIRAIGPSHANFELVMPKPSALILGSQVSADNEKQMLDICQKRSIPLKRMVRQTSGFGLDMRSIWAT